MHRCAHVLFTRTPVEGQQVSTTVFATITAGTNEIPTGDALEGVPEGSDVVVGLVDAVGQQALLLGDLHLGERRVRAAAGAEREDGHTARTRRGD